MARAIWSGALAFGLVNVPVKLHTAVAQKELRFNMLHAKDGARIRMKRFCSAEDREVPYEEIVKGFEVSRDRYVALTPEELAAYDPKATRTVEIRDFVDLSEIDPVYYERTYYLVPEKTAAQAYRLLVDAMRATGKVAIASFVLRTRESLCCVRPLDGGARPLHHEPGGRGRAPARRSTYRRRRSRRSASCRWRASSWSRSPRPSSRRATRTSTGSACSSSSSGRPRARPSSRPPRRRRPPRW